MIKVFNPQKLNFGDYKLKHGVEISSAFAYADIEAGEIHFWLNVDSENSSFSEFINGLNPISILRATFAGITEDNFIELMNIDYRYFDDNKHLFLEPKTDDENSQLPEGLEYRTGKWETKNYPNTSKEADDAPITDEFLNRYGELTKERVSHTGCLHFYYKFFTESGRCFSLEFMQEKNKIGLTLLRCGGGVFKGMTQNGFIDYFENLYSKLKKRDE